MYKIIVENLGRLKMPTNIYYAEILGITTSYISNILGGKLAVKETIAKGMIAVAYNITLDDERMTELLEKHFTKEK